MISVTITERSQRRCAPSWLKEKPYLKVTFTDDSVITKVKESWRIKLTQDSKELDGCLTKFTFLVGQIVWCYWKTANEKEKTYFFLYLFFYYKYDTFSWSVPTEPPQQDQLCISTWTHTYSLSWAGSVHDWLPVSLDYPTWKYNSTALLQKLKFQLNMTDTLLELWCMKNKKQ